jgi:hypothetical protein
MEGYSEILDGYSPLLFEHRVPASLHADFRKWVRFYLDFCEKYGHPPRSSDSLAPFLAKLGQKNQGEDRISQAGQAVSLLYNLVKRDPESKRDGGARRGQPQATVAVMPSPIGGLRPAGSWE